MKKVSFVSVGF